MAGSPCRVCPRAPAGPVHGGLPGLLWLLPSGPALCAGRGAAVHRGAAAPGVAFTAAQGGLRSWGLRSWGLRSWGLRYKPPASPGPLQIHATRLIPLLSPKQEIADATGKVFLAERETRRLREKLQQEQETVRWLQQQVIDARTQAADAARDREVAELVRDRVSKQLAEAARDATAAAEQLARLTADAAQQVDDAEARVEKAEAQVQCVVCFDAPRSHLPGCGHLSMCHGCAARVNPQACPICKKKFRAARKVFLS